MTPLAAALSAAFPVRVLTGDEVFRVARGQSELEAAEMPMGPVAAVATDGICGGVAGVSRRAGAVARGVRAGYA